MSRTSLYILLFVCALFLGLLWVLLGGGKSPAQTQDVLLTSADEEVLLEETPTPYTPPRSTLEMFSGSSSGGDSSGGTFSSDSGSLFASREGEDEENSSFMGEFDPYFGLDPKFLSDVRGLSKPSLEERQKRIRDKLRAQGFVNEEYIQLKVLAAEEQKFEAEMDQAKEAAANNDPDAALKILLDIENRLDPKNWIYKEKIWGYIGTLAGKSGWPELFMEASSKSLDYQARVLEISMKTKLAEDPDKRAQMQERYDMLTSNRANMLGMAQATMTMFKENGGLHPELKRMRNAAAVNVTNQLDRVVTTKDMNQGLQDIDSQLETYWQAPRSGRP